MSVLDLLTGMADISGDDGNDERRAENQGLHLPPLAVQNLKTNESESSNRSHASKAMRRFKLVVGMCK